MSIKPKFAGLFGLAAVAALLAMSVGASAAFAFPEFKASKFPVEFKGTGGTATFESTGKNTVTCEKSESTGKVESAISVLVDIVYSGKCTLKAVTPITVTEECPSIKTKSLLIMPVFILPSLRVGLLISAQAGEGAIAEFTCSGSDKVKVKVTGSVICLPTPVGKPVTAGEVICKKVAGKPGVQEFTESENSAKEKTLNHLTAESTLGIFKTSETDSQETTEKVEYKEPVELTEK